MLLNESFEAVRNSSRAESDLALPFWMVLTLWAKTDFTGEIQPKSFFRFRWTCLPDGLAICTAVAVLLTDDHWHTIRATMILWKASGTSVDCASSHVTMSGSISAAVVSFGARLLFLPRLPFRVADVYSIFYSEKQAPG